MQPTVVGQVSERTWRGDISLFSQVQAPRGVLFFRMDGRLLYASEAAQEMPTSSVEPLKEEILFDDFAKVDLRLGTIVEAALVPRAKKLLQLTVDIGVKRLNVFAGIRSQFDPTFLKGKQVAVVANLKPRKMRFGVSEGMVVAAENPDSGELALLTPLREEGAEGMLPGATIS